MKTDEEWIELAWIISQKAECQKRRVGTVIVDANGVMVGQGFNHDPTGEKDCFKGECPRAFTGTPANTGDYDLCITAHAEASAIIDAGNLARTSTMYSTSTPCAGCLKLIYLSGIRKYVHPGGILPL